MSPEAAASALVSPFTELDWVSLEIWAAIFWALAASRDPTTTERPALAYWKARRLPMLPVPGITAIVRRVKSSAAITPPKTYYHQNPNQPETKTQPRKIQTMTKWKKQQQRFWIVEACSTKCDVKNCWTQNSILLQRLAEQRQKFLSKLHIASRHDIPPRFSPPRGCRMSHCSRFFHLLLRFLFAFDLVSRWQTCF